MSWLYRIMKQLNLVTYGFLQRGAIIQPATPPSRRADTINSSIMKMRYLTDYGDSGGNSVDHTGLLCKMKMFCCRKSRTSRMTLYLLPFSISNPPNIWSNYL